MRFASYPKLFFTLAFLVDIINGVNTCFEAASSDFRDCTAGAFSTTSYPGELKLDDCGLVDADIPDVIECFDNFGRGILSTIGLGGNAFTELPDSMFDGSWPELIGLSLDRNNISSLPAGLLSGLTKLEYLDLSNNSLVDLPEGTFGGLTELESLGLEHNMLTELPVDVFSDLEGMEVLDLQNNKLVELKPDVFDGLGGRITFLYLSHNELSELPAGLFSASGSLNYLYLDGNDLTTLPVDIFSPLTELFVLDLRGNENLQCVPSVPERSAQNIYLPDNYDEEANCQETAITCSNGLSGIEENGVCCPASCGTCGGTDCAKLPGGPEDCCTRAIWESGEMCTDSGAPPCIVEFEVIPCSNGIPGVQSGDICCSAECGKCGGTGCRRRPGGGEECCVGLISLSSIMCSESGAAPCIMN